VAQSERVERLAHRNPERNDERPRLCLICERRVGADRERELGGGDYHATGSAALALDTWTHVAVTYDGTALRLFINDVEGGSIAAAGSLVASTGPLSIGANAVWGEHFRGLIDEVRVYNRALTATEIQTDMNTAVQ
jgi:concanavalin A-like lectin/glucanase superfamily protein